MWGVMGMGIEKRAWVVLNGEKDATEITRQILAAVKDAGYNLHITENLDG